MSAYETATPFSTRLFEQQRSVHGVSKLGCATSGTPLYTADAQDERLDCEHTGISHSCRARDHGEGCIHVVIEPWMKRGSPQGPTGLRLAVPQATARGGAKPEAESESAARSPNERGRQAWQPRLQKTIEPLHCQMTWSLRVDLAP